MATLEQGILLTGSLPDFIKPFYQSLLLSIARPALIYDQLASVVVDTTKGPGQLVYFTKVFDIPESTTPLAEDVAYVESEILDDQQVSITIQEFGQVIKTSRKLELTQYLNEGNLAGLIKDKLAFGMAKSMNIRARNQLLAGATHVSFGNDGGADRASIGSAEKTTPDMVEQVVRNMKNRDALGWDENESLVCLTDASVVYDLRKHTDWRNPHMYSAPEQIFNGELGRIAGVRFLGSTLGRLPNAGTISAQGSVNGATAKKAAYITINEVPSVAGFAAGQEVTLVSALNGASLVDESDAEYETFVIDHIVDGTKRIYPTAPLKKSHSNAAVVVDALDLHPLIFLAPGALGKAVAMNPEIRVAPVIDDFGRMNRVAWYGIYDYGVLQDRFLEVWYVATS